MVDKTERLGQRFEIAYFWSAQALTETFDVNEIAFIGRYLEVRGFIEDENQTYRFQVTGKGFERAEELKKLNASSSQCFVAMSFNANLQAAWQDGLRVGITAAGYAPLRIDGKEHNQKICDEIVAEIRRSRFVVADFSGHRGGVYYEAGFAAGLGLQVIFTCQRDELADIHFDVRQFNTIDWANPADLAQRLETRISATIGDGPRRSKV